MPGPSLTERKRLVSTFERLAPQFTEAGLWLVMLLDYGQFEVYPSRDAQRGWPMFSTGNPYGLSCYLKGAQDMRKAMMPTFPGESDEELRLGS